MHGCTGQIRGLDDTLTPLMTIQVAVPRDQIASLPEEVKARLRVGVLWAGINFPSAWCAEQFSPLITASSRTSDDDSKPGESSPEASMHTLENLNSESFDRLFQVLELCPDPFGVVPALAGPSIPLSSGIDREEYLVLDIPFTALPPAEVIIGTPDARVAYGSVVIFDDLDEDQVLDIGFALPFGFGKEFVTSEDDEDNGSSPENQNFFDDPVDPDMLYGASFTTLLETQQRLVFREGRFAESFFYPHGHCVPPSGLSVMTVNPEVYGSLANVSCEIHRVDEPLIVELSGPSARLQELVCEPPEVWISRADPYTSLLDNDPLDFELTCLSPWELVISNTGQTCKTLSVIRLLDCPSDDLMCDNSRWNDLDQPPSWWPCGV